MSKIVADGHEIELSHEEKIFFPPDITKKDLIDYYLAAGDLMLPFLKDRLLVMHRYPDGIEGEKFYQKDAPDYFPRWIKTKRVAKKIDGTVNYIICQNIATLIYIANQACITPHIWLSKADQLTVPDRLIWDLDPSTSHSFDLVLKAAEQLKELLEKLGVNPFVMTTGSRGLHVVVPLSRKHRFKAVKNFARLVAEILVRANPKEFTLETIKEKRGERLFIDTMRNNYGATSVAPYAVRGRPGAPVATPLEWKELDKVETSQKYNINNIFEHLKKHKNPWDNFDKKAQSLDEALKAIKKISGINDD